MRDPTWCGVCGLNGIGVKKKLGLGFRLTLVPTYCSSQLKLPDFGNYGF